MDAELMAVATTGANTLITLMATDAWGQAKRAIATLFAQSRPEAGPIVESELEESRRDLMAARERGDNQTEEELIAQWQGRLRRLLVTDPDIAKALRTVVDDLGASAAELSMGTESISLHGKATGHGRIYQQGQGVQQNR